MTYITVISDQSKGILIFNIPLKITYNIRIVKSSFFDLFELEIFVFTFLF